MSQLTIINPSERDYACHRYVLWFGAVGTTYLMVWGHLEDALEACADWLADNAPGHIMKHNDPELRTLYLEACEELFPGVAEDDLEDEQRWEAQEQATADMTYTEAGYITSYEWGIALDEHATRAEVKEFIAELEARHYSDSPVVAVG